MNVRPGASSPGAPTIPPDTAPAPTSTTPATPATSTTPVTGSAAAWLLGALVIASVVAVDPAGLAPFGPSKWLAVSVLALAGGGLALRRGLVAVDRSSNRLWLGLLACLTFGAFAGNDILVALFGHPDRHLGLFTWLLLFVVFCAGQQLHSRADVRSLCRAAVVASLFIGWWCAWELAFGRPVDIATDTSRLTGPFGSAAILGAATCLLLPVAIGGALDTASSQRWRIASTAAACSATLALVGSGSRAAWGGVIIATIVVLVRTRPGRIVLATGAVVVIAAMALLAPRLDDVIARSSGAGSRLDEWSMAARVIGAHPLVGVGPEGYRIAVSEGIDAEYERTYGRDGVLPDRAHAGPLDVALAGGIPAAIAHVALVVLVGRRAVRSMRLDPLTDGLAAAFVAYSIQQVVLFPLAELDPVWWLFAGVIVTASRNETRARALPTARRARLAAVPLLIAPLALGAGVLDVAADRLARRAVDGIAPGSNERPAAVAAAVRAAELRPDSLRYRLIAAEALGRSGTLAGVDAAIEQARRALDWSPLDPIAADVHASYLLERAAITGDSADVAAAFDEWSMLTDRDPVRARWQIQFGRSAALADEVEVARAAWARAAKLAPDDPTPGLLLDELDRH